MDLAAYYGNFSVLVWLNNNRKEGCTQDAMDGSIVNSHLDISMWLYENIFPDIDVYSYIHLGIKNNQLSTVKWLYVIKPSVRKPLTITGFRQPNSSRLKMDGMSNIDVAAFYGNLDIFTWLYREKGEKITQNTLEYAIKNDRSEILEFIIDNE